MCSWNGFGQVYVMMSARAGLYSLAFLAWLNGLQTWMMEYIYTTDVKNTAILVIKFLHHFTWLYLHSGPENLEML